jgi:rubrerythrin
MSKNFNADEIFEMAEQIEKNGATFYREAAQSATDKETEHILLDMALMEDGHLQTFQEMRESLSPREKEEIAFDPNNEAALYLQAMADSRGTEGKINKSQKLTGQETIREILKIAIDAEKNSVAFYAALKEMVSAKAGKDRVQAIIKEEMSHVVTLCEKIKTVA